MPGDKRNHLLVEGRQKELTESESLHLGVLGLIYVCYAEHNTGYPVQHVYHITAGKTWTDINSALAEVPR